MSDQLAEMMEAALRRRELSELLPMARTLRVRAGLTQAQIATLLSVGRAAIARWEAGTRVPRGAPLTRYVGVLVHLARQVKTA